MDVRFRKKIREAGIYLEQFTTEFQADAGIARGSGILSDQFVQFLTHCKCSSRSPSHPGQAAPFWKKKTTSLSGSATCETFPPRRHKSVTQEADYTPSVSWEKLETLCQGGTICTFPEGQRDPRRSSESCGTVSLHSRGVRVRDPCLPEHVPVLGAREAH